MNAFMTSTADPQRDRQYREVQRGDVVRPRAPHPGQSGHGQDGRQKRRTSRRPSGPHFPAGYFFAAGLKSAANADSSKYTHSAPALQVASCGAPPGMKT